MAKKSLKVFGKFFLDKIIKQLGGMPHVFNNEAEFKFELALKIKEYFDCKVRFEALTRRNYRVIINNNGIQQTRLKNDYTDIVLEDNEDKNLKIPIELKYKTDLYKDKSNNIYLKKHGAYDLGAYDFIRDIDRLQLIVNKQPNIQVKKQAGEQDYDSILNCCCGSCGYAIILTNDHHYWTEPKNKNTINRKFLIYGDKAGFGKISQGMHEWFDTNGVPGLSKAILNDKSRQQSLFMRTDYDYQWQQYLNVNKDNGDFRFMIVEV